MTWRDGPDLVPARPGAVGWALVLLRGGPLVTVLALGLGLKLLVRAVERPLAGARRPLSPWITVAVCRIAMRILGLRVEARGRPMQGPGALVANHSSWLDILVLNAQAPVVFVSKAEVAGWPGIGLLARATGTVFIRREARGEVAAQAQTLAERIGQGARLALFPEGTSTDNRRVLPFRPALFAGLMAGPAVQPVTLRYEAPEGEDPRFFAWYGGMDLGPHALAVLAARRGGRVKVTFHPPIPVAGRDRKTLAAEAEASVRSAL
ncbi:1-acyl-sn-glycerol-3-phosphate acyltransferase [Rubellimicrobium roseum]|uniref:1-acyl-sn-glycerol-3-phosphate acyltransferase n=1 Tax=Rubellimicrobium roseum TaxID=687525 RepID=A0A5C4NBD0_9RHOB|nr:1-acyl-sn-glycerol-3-phosphate acyltransferase [Rubellimicrobium roseum]